MRYLRLRFKLAWKAFMLQPFEYQLKPFHFYCNLISNAGECDNGYKWKKYGCKNQAKIALAETIIRMEINRADYYHVCEDCAKKFTGAKYKAD